MKTKLARLACVGLMSLSVLAVGCGETASVKETTEVSGPDGKTVIEKTESVKQTGDNPPPVAPVEKPATP